VRPAPFDKLTTAQPAIRQTKPRCGGRRGGWAWNQRCAIRGGQKSHCLRQRRRICGEVSRGVPLQSSLAFGVAIIPNLVTRPYKLRTIDQARSVYRIRFHNEQFTEMVRRASTDHENAAFRVH